MRVGAGCECLLKLHNVTLATAPTVLTVPAPLVIRRLLLANHQAQTNKR